MELNNESSDDVAARIKLAALRNRTLRIGDVIFAFHRLRPPCAYLDRVQRVGTARARFR